jgi:hypothetical protein
MAYIAIPKTKQNIKRWSDARLEREMAIVGTAFSSAHVEAIRWWQTLCIEHVRRQSVRLTSKLRGSEARP